jgi:hypothetical protein
MHEEIGTQVAARVLGAIAEIERHGRVHVA